MTIDLPINPDLPEGFDNTPNEDRTKEELDAWWDRPFALTNKDGTFSVRCLHGGAWDRSSWMGEADTIEQAKVLAQTKLTEWQFTRARPSFSMDDDKVSVVRMPQRPDQEMTIFGTFNSFDDAGEFFNREFPEYAKASKAPQ